MAGETPRGRGARDSFLAGIWAAVPTPFHSDGRLDLEGVAANARRFADVVGLDGIFCNGLMGEVWALALDERKRALEAHLSGADARLKVGVVVSHHALAETVELARHAAAVGADHIVVTRPSAFLSAEELRDYVRAVVDAADAPVLLFDSAAQSGGYPREIIRELAAEGLIGGVKCTRSADEIIELRAYCGDLITIADPYERNWLANLVRFDLRCLYADPEPYLFQNGASRLIEAYYRAYCAGDLGDAAALFERLEPLRRVYEEWILEPLRRGRPMNAALKHWCARVGLSAGPVRPPLKPLDAAAAGRLDRALDAAFAAVFGARDTPAQPRAG